MSPSQVHPLERGLDELFGLNRVPADEPRGLQQPWRSAVDEVHELLVPIAAHERLPYGRRPSASTHP